MPMFYVDRVISDQKSSNYFIVLSDRESDNRISYLVKESVAERIAVTLDSFDATYTSLHRLLHDFIIKNGWSFDSISVKEGESESLFCSMNLSKGKILFNSLLSFEDLFIISIISPIDIMIETTLYDRFEDSSVLMIDNNNKLLSKHQRLETLNKIVARSILDENYELAASIRDRIKKIK